MDEKFFFDAMNAVGMNIIVIDEWSTPYARRAFRQERPTPAPGPDAAKYSPQSSRRPRVPGDLSSRAHGCACPAGHHKPAAHAKPRPSRADRVDTARVGIDWRDSRSTEE
jgi:hypothetical protein